MELLFDLSFSYRKLFFFSLSLSLFPSSNTVSSYHFGPFWYYCWPVWSSDFSALLQVLDLSLFLMPKLTGRMKSKAKREGLHIRVCAKFSLVGSFSPSIWERKQPSNCCSSQHVDRYVNASVFWAFINPADIKVERIQVGERKENLRIRVCTKFSLVGLFSPWIWERKQPLNHLSSHVGYMTVCVVSILLTLLTSRLKRFRCAERKSELFERCVGFLWYFDFCCTTKSHFCLVCSFVDWATGGWQPPSLISLLMYLPLL